MDIITLLNEILGEHVRQKDEFLFHCPFCHSQKKKLSINISNNKWKCWVCNSRGGHILWLLKKLHVSKETLLRFKKLFSDDDIKLYKAAEISTEIHLPPEYEPMWKVKDSYVYKHAVSYLKKRNITASDVLRYKLGFCETGQYAGRIIIPSYDEHNKLNYFTARSFFDSNLKYKNPLVSKNVVVFENLVNFNERVVLCEGMFDGIAIKQNAIPLLGKTIPPILLEKLVENRTPEIIIYLDPDAKKEALYNKTLLNRYGFDKVSVVTPSGDDDAANVGHEESIKNIEEAQSISFKQLIKEKLSLVKT